MPLDGLRAWIGEVERKLGMRTRVFLVLAVIAIGGAGAAVYLAIDANRSSVSEGDVQELQRQLEARIADGAGGGAELAQVEAEVSELKAEVERLQGKGGGSGQGGGASGGGSSKGGTSGGSGSAGGKSSGAGKSGGSGGGGKGSSGASTGAAPNASGNDGSARLQELLEKARKKAEEAEGK
jgi:hypothetical protein